MDIRIERQSSVRADASASGVDANVSSCISDMTEVSRMNASELSKRRILHAGTRDKAALSAFKEVGAGLLKRSKGKNFVVLVTSPVSESGSTFFATNLGATLVMDAAKTALLIDCNWHDSGMVNLLSVESDFGLTDYLVDDELDVDDIIYASPIPRLRVIPSGNKSDSGAKNLVSDRMANCIQCLKERYPDRYLIIDAPPVDTWKDEHFLTELCDFAVLVVPYGMVTKEQISFAVKAIGDQKLLGMVINN